MRLPGKVVVMIFVAFLATASHQVFAGTTYEQDPPPSTHSYGNINFGLKMTAWFDPQSVTVRCVIQNGYKVSVLYCDYLVGNFEFVLLYARRSTNDPWQYIPLHQNLMRPYLSAGPTERNIRWLGSGKVMPPGPYGMRPGSSNKSKLKHTFEVNLIDYQFPADWDDTIECKIKQRMCNTTLNESGGDRTLETEIFKVPLSLIRQK